MTSCSRHWLLVAHPAGTPTLHFPMHNLVCRCLQMTALDTASCDMHGGGGAFVLGARVDLVISTSDSSPKAANWLRCWLLASAGCRCLTPDGIATPLAACRARLRCGGVNIVRASHLADGVHKRPSRRAGRGGELSTMDLSAVGGSPRSQPSCRLPSGFLGGRGLL